jgi:hypothetical protein
MLEKELRYPNLQHYYWTDSKIVLGFINNEAKRFHVYVANRVQKIRDMTSVDQWHHVSTCSNPADLASRGTSADELLKSMWLNGPEFLWEKQLPLTDDNTSCLLEEGCEEVKLPKSCFATQVSATDEEFLPIKYTSWMHAKRVLAGCVKFVDNLKNKTKGGIVVSDLINAERILIKKVQESAFKEELKLLQAKDTHVQSSSSLYKLDTFLDEYGLLRVGGRIRESSLPFEEKHPLILPKKHFISDLIARHCHEKSCHQGRGITMSSIRSHGYWIIGLSSVVSSLIHKCAMCRKFRHISQGQKMSPLPSDRLDPGPAFTQCHVAVDCFGPFFIKDRRKEVKRYGILFTCLTSRAIHLDAISSLDTDAFINALRRFMSVIREPILWEELDNYKKLLLRLIVRNLNASS